MGPDQRAATQRVFFIIRFGRIQSSHPELLDWNIAAELLGRIR